MNFIGSLYRMRKAQLCGLCVFLCLCGTCEKLALGASNEELAKYLIDGFVNERESWITGVARLSGTVSRNTPSGWEDRDFDVKISFDTSISSVRYDIRAGGSTSSGGVYIRTSENQVECITGPGAVVAIKGVDEAPSGFVVAPDLHSMGLVPVNDFLRGTTLSSFRSTLEGFTPYSVSLGQAIATVKFRFEFPEGAYLADFRINESRGFAVEEVVLSEASKTRDEGASIAITKTRWQDIGGKFLPVEYECIMQESKCKLLVKWESFNEPLAAAIFEAKSVANVDGALITDRRLGPGVIVGKVGQPDYVPPPRDRGWGSPVSGGSSRLRLVITGVNIFFVCLIVLVVIRRRLRRSP